MNDWERLKVWNTDDELDGWLRQQGLQNAEAIIVRLVTGASVEFAKGTKRLRYERNKFYLERHPPTTNYDAGIGKQLNLTAIQEELQRRAGAIEVTVKLDSKMETAVALKEFEVNNICGFAVRLNPMRLRGTQQVNSALEFLRKEIK